MSDLTLLDNDKHVRSDARLIARAVKNRWPVNDDVKAEAITRLRTIVNKRSVDVMTKDGPVPMEGPADANAIAAARVLQAMEGQNQKDEHHHDGKTVHHEHEHVLKLDAKRTRLLAVARRLGIAVNAGGAGVGGEGGANVVPAKPSGGAKA